MKAPAPIRQLIVLGGGWLAEATRRAALTDGHAVETLRRIDRPDVYPPARPSALRSLLSDADAVVNACGALRGDEETLDAANHRLAQFIAEAAASAEVRLVHVGSAAEYGVPVSARAREDDEPTPTGAYGRSKLAGTRAVLSTCGHGRAIVARVFNPVGLGQPDHLPVAEFARAVRSPDRGPVTIRNSATERDFVAIDDVGRALVALAIGDRTPHPVVNVCSGVGLGYGTIVRAMLNQVGSDRSIRSLDEPTVLSVVGDPSRLAEATGLRLASTAERIAALALAAG